MNGSFYRPRLPLVAVPTWPNLLAVGPGATRAASRYQAFDACLDPEELRAAREWRQSFRQEGLPKGTTVYSRSSGPGGQHVNKTESKATTSWTVGELAGLLPTLLRAKIRSSRYYAKHTDTLTIQAQTQRSRAANAEDNRQKLYDELVKIYEETVPGESSPGKKEKYNAVEKAFHESRIREKKQKSSKKQSRRGGGSED